MALARLKATVIQDSSQLADHIDEIEGLLDAADNPVIERQGWASDATLTRLNDVIRLLTYWDGLARRLAPRSQR
jgi:hypothetical protein